MKIATVPAAARAAVYRAAAADAAVYAAVRDVIARAIESYPVDQP